jgi:hypothetical protein
MLFFQYIDPLRDTFDVNWPTALVESGVSYNAIAYHTSIGSAPISLIFRDWEENETMILSLAIADTSNFAIVGTFPYGDTLNGCYPLEIKFLGHDTGLFRTTMSVHMNSGYDGKDTTFVFPMFVHVTAQSSVAMSKTSPDDLKIFPNPSMGAFLVQLSNGLSASLQAVDISGKTILRQELTPGSNSILVPQGVRGILLLRFNVIPDSGPSYVISKKLVVE